MKGKRVLPATELAWEECLKTQYFWLSRSSVPSERSSVVCSFWPFSDSPDSLTSPALCQPLSLVLMCDRGLQPAASVMASCTTEHVEPHTLTEEACAHVPAGRPGSQQRRRLRTCLPGLSEPHPLEPTAPAAGLSGRLMMVPPASPLAKWVSALQCLLHLVMQHSGYRRNTAK